MKFVELYEGKRKAVVGALARGPVAEPPLIWLLRVVDGDVVVPGFPAAVPEAEVVVIIDTPWPSFLSPGEPVLEGKLLDEDCEGIVAVPSSVKPGPTSTGWKLLQPLTVMVSRSIELTLTAIEQAE